MPARVFPLHNRSRAQETIKGAWPKESAAFTWRGISYLAWGWRGRHRFSAWYRLLEWNIARVCQFHLRSIQILIRQDCYQARQETESKSLSCFDTAKQNLRWKAYPARQLGHQIERLWCRFVFNSFLLTTDFLEPMSTFVKRTWYLYTRIQCPPQKPWMSFSRAMRVAERLVSASST